MILLGTWILFVVYPFYVTRLINANKAILAAATKQKKKKTFWQTVRAELRF